MYRVFQFFVLALKIDIFTGFMVSIFYLIQFAMKQGVSWESIVQVVVTVLILPFLYFARTAVSSKQTNKQKRKLSFLMIPLLLFLTGQHRK
jgi:hypothetical protein